MNSPNVTEDSNDMHKDYGDEGGLSHIIYMYIFCFGIIAALLVIIMMIRCLLKLKKKAKAQFTKLECERRPSSMSAHDASLTKDTVEIDVLDHAPLVT